MNPKVDHYLSHLPRWQTEMAKLRKILLSTPLTEELKWGKPCYQLGTNNLVILYALRESCALGFLKGALLADPKGILVAPGEHSQSARWIKFTDVQQITRLTPTIEAYLREAMAAEKAGLKVKFRQQHDLVFPEEFQNRLKKDRALKTTFEALTPGRKRGYHLYFSGAKQSATREARIEKCIPRILAGRGLNDR